MRVRHFEYVLRTGLRLALWFAVGSALATCDAAPYQGVRAATADTQPAQPTPQVTLEFDLPNEFSARGADNSHVVTGFRVGVFKGAESKPVSTVDLTRDQVIVNGQTGSVTFDRSRLPRNMNGSVLRVQTLTRDTTSDWSDPTAPVAKAGKSPAKAARATPKKRDAKRAATLNVEAHPRLLEAVRKALPPEVKAEDVTARFHTAEDLAVSVVLCEQEKLSLEKLSTLMQGPPARNLRAALRELRPDWDSRAAVKKARQQSKALLATSK